ncbi:MAG TPA: thiamine pyrophosphate-binding protein [Dongiaceae bacterium]|nr:thiamine pyrophosphate-binding protein [Dongiaceae bacterium]
MTSCAHVIANYIKAAGIEYIFGYPGDPNIEFMEAARRQELPFVLGRREGTAGFMAQAYGFITGRPGIAMSTLGPGSSNLVAAVASAYLDRIPMIAISGQIDTTRDGLFTHQVLNHNALFSPITKWAVSIQRSNTGQIMRKALRLSAAERPGPVHITTPADIVGAECSDDALVLPPASALNHDLQVLGTANADADIAGRLAKARRPVIVTGISAVRANAGDALRRFAEKLGCPVVVSPMAKGILPEDHPYYAGTLDMACNDFIWSFLKSSDLILAVGFDAVELIKPWRVAVPTIHIDSTPNTDQIYIADTELVGRIDVALDALADRFKGEPRWAEREIAEHRDALRKLYYTGRVSGHLNPTDVVDSVRAAFPRETVISCDVGSHKHLIGQGWQAYARRGVLMTNGLSSMGYSLPAAIVSALLDRSSRPVCFIGDGSLAMVQSELRLAAELKLNLTVVVLCDESLNRIELKQLVRQYPSFGTRIERTDMASLAQSMDCDGIMVDGAAGLEKALAAAPRNGRPLVIGAIIDPAQYNAHF